MLGIMEIKIDEIELQQLWYEDKEMFWMKFQELYHAYVSYEFVLYDPKTFIITVKCK